MVGKLESNAETGLVEAERAVCEYCGCVVDPATRTSPYYFGCPKCSWPLKVMKVVVRGNGAKSEKMPGYVKLTRAEREQRMEERKAARKWGNGNSEIKIEEVYREGCH